MERDNREGRSAPAGGSGGGTQDKFVRCFPSQCGMRAIGSVRGRHLVSATKRRDHSSRPLGCLSATEEYS
jgi:hypothetical protein